MARYGLSWDDLRLTNPDLVMLSISGFGQHGPERDRASYAAIVHAEVGLLDRQASVDGDRASDMTLSVADSFTALHGLVGVLAALHLAKSTGIGQHIDLAMVDATVATDDYAHMALEGAKVAAGGGQIFEATGGPIILAGDEKWWWHQLSRHGNLDDPTPPGADLPTKIASRRRAIEQHLLSFPDRDALLSALDQANLAWGNVRDYRRVYDEQPTIKGRGAITTVDDRRGGQRRVTQSPYRYSAAKAGVRGPAPLRGEHNEQALTEWLALGADEVAKLRSAGVLLDPTP
jgi:crotonobetainyl-CoA:carnitine CoA-transferase CaiB-like acyl-CoA transferase